ncbi:hypothetical protein [Halocynthiibacter sp.]|uniref:hypothetical protein n=1 Tax=Halocynthiibacter sp. TaxID=1979210 RepID=UPI003C532AF3
MINTNLLLGIAGGIIAINAAIGAILPTPAFLEVHDMTVVGDQVRVVRSVPGPAGVADWTVVVVADATDAPSCQTVSGPLLHQGWSKYSASPKREISMHLDVWVGYEGCYDKLAAGKHDMFVTWTPRDGRPVVSARTTFTK